MQCRACGRQSRSADMCEWCKQPVTGGQAPVPSPEPTVAMPPMPPAAMRRRVALTGEVIEEPDPTVDLNRTQAMPMPAAPPPRYQPAPTIAMNRSAREMAAPLQRRLADISYGERWEKFLAIGLPILLISLWIAHAAPGVAPWMVYVDLFVLSLAMGATRAIPMYEDDAADVTIVLTVTLLFGPLLAIVAYGIVGMLKQDANPAIVGLFVLYGVVSGLITLAFFSNMESFSYFALFGFFQLLAFMAVFVSFAGWLLSSFFRPLDE